ncbi:MAG: hypothetical protein Q8Q26_02415, partial [Pseudorhodobacter sp.]|nr:hypothetical protein [Pseudorhodobacter sp.]
ASVQRRRRPVSVTERISTSGLYLWSDITSDLSQNPQFKKTAPGVGLRTSTGKIQKFVLREKAKEIWTGRPDAFAQTTGKESVEN